MDEYELVIELWFCGSGAMNPIKGCSIIDILEKKLHNLLWIVINTY